MLFDYFAFLRGLVDILRASYRPAGRTDGSYFRLLKLAKNLADQLAGGGGAGNDDALRRLVDAILVVGRTSLNGRELQSLINASLLIGHELPPAHGTRRGMQRNKDAGEQAPGPDLETGKTQPALTDVAHQASNELAVLLGRTTALSVKFGQETEETPRLRQIRVTGRALSGETVTTFTAKTRYVLHFCVAAPAAGNLARGHVDVTDVPDSGLAARWIVTSTNVEFRAVAPNGIVEKRGNMWLAQFDLEIPGRGDSETVRLDVCTSSVRGEIRVTLLAAGEEYRKLTVSLGFGARVTEDVVTEDIVCTAPAHLHLEAPHESTRPPEHLAVNVAGQIAIVSTILGTRDYGTVGWGANSVALKNPIQRVRKALDKFRMSGEAHLNDVDVADMERRLETGQWKVKDWSNLPRQADAAHDRAFTTFASGRELRALASDGYSLFDTCFPRGSELRTIIENLDPGSRLDFIWTSRSAVDWVSHVPWALMYLDPVKPTQQVDCGRFLGLRYRIGSKSWEPKAPSRALGDPTAVNALHFLYWGTDPNDAVGMQSRWQREEFGKWAQQNFVPDLNEADPKRQVMLALETPRPHPAGIIYFYCHCSVTDGSDPVLQFGETAKLPDIVEASDICQDSLEAKPLVFANACATTASDPQGTSELESRFFARDIRAFLGTETKVPVVFASRFAWLFFQFFLRKADPAPVAAGEALAQARLFLWTQYRNPGGLFYCLVNQYDLYLASDEEVAHLRRA